MSELHPQLERQLRNVGASDRSGSLEPRALRELLAAVSRAYHDADAERSAREEREEALGKAQERLEAIRESHRTEGDWLTGLGPGIRSPLSELAERADVLLETDLVGELREDIDTLRQSARTALASLDDVLDWAGMEAGTLEIDRIRFDLRPAVEEVAGALAPLAEEKGLELVVRYDPSAPRHVVGDPGRIRQVLFNLLRHSVATTREGWVLVDVSCERRTEADTVLRFAVEDSGQGIARLELQRIYEAAGTNQRPHLPEPSALGLAVASRLARLMGGRVGSRNDPGLWSALWFELALPLDTQATELRVEDLTDVRIMVVDASDARRHALEDQLGHWDMRCTSFASGAGALRELRQAIDDEDPFRIAILSTRIEGMDAELLGDLIKSDAALRDVDLVLLTALGEKGTAKRLREIGFSGYLVKPIREAPLKETLQCVWGARKHGVDQTLVTRHTLTESGIFELTESPAPKHV
jgi:signal transduction histidine kinase/DNA-binding NarL/FixJ family response regulator